MNDDDTIEDLIDDEARSRIGTELSRGTGTVVAKEFQRWAAAVKDRNPLYFDADYARAQGYRDVVMPPMYLGQITQGVYDLDRLRPDGIPLGDGAGDIALPHTPRRLAGGEDITFHEPIYDRDVITAVRVVESIEQKQGRAGPFIMMRSRVTYTRQDGVVVAEAFGTLIAKP
jgi:acyl dehydratase